MTLGLNGANGGKDTGTDGAVGIKDSLGLDLGHNGGGTRELREVED